MIYKIRNKASGLYLKSSRWDKAGKSYEAVRAARQISTIYLRDYAPGWTAKYDGTDICRRCGWYGGLDQFGRRYPVSTAVKHLDCKPRLVVYPSEIEIVEFDLVERGVV